MPLKPNTKSKLMILLPSDLPESRWLKICERVGQDPDSEPEFIDAGTKGSVFLLDDGKILKLTSDESEAQSAAIVMRNPDPVVYKVWDVFEVPVGADKLWCIVQEKLAPADRDWGEFAQLFYHWHTDLMKKLNETTTETTRRVPYINEDLVLEFVEFLEKDHGGFDRWGAQIMWLDRLSTYLQKVKIKFMDLHKDNIMKRPNSDHCVIDLGYAKSPRVHIDVVARLIARKLVAAAGLKI